MSRKIVSLCIVILLILSCGFSAFAEELDYNKTGSISVTLTEQYQHTPIVGAELSVYYVASVGVNTDGQLNYIYNQPFAQSGIPIDDLDLAEKLDGFVSQNNVPATKLETDAAGRAVFTDLPLGLYFVKQTGSVAGYAPCRSFVVTVPGESPEGYVYHVNASPKTEVAKLTDITIKKVWNTSGAVKATESVTVCLLKNGVVVETAVLNEENNWQVTYTGVPESDAYTIQEIDVPEGFTATYKQNGYVFTVTNTSTLSQTGQRIWPIPVLGFAGIVFIVAGCLLLQKKRKQDA